MERRELLEKAQEGNKIKVSYCSENGKIKTGYAYISIAETKNGKRTQINFLPCGYAAEADFVYAISNNVQTGYVRKYLDVINDEEYFSIGEIYSADYQIIEGRQYYLILNKCYISNPSERYLNCAIDKDGDIEGLELNTFAEGNLGPDGTYYKTRFTREEIKNLIDEFGTDIRDFEMEEVE